MQDFSKVSPFDLVGNTRAHGKCGKLKIFERERYSEHPESVLFYNLYKDILPTWMYICYNKGRELFHVQVRGPNRKHNKYIGKLKNIKKFGPKIEKIKEELAEEVKERIGVSVARSRRFYVKKKKYIGEYPRYVVVDEKFKKEITVFISALYDSKEQALELASSFCSELNRLVDFTPDKVPSAFFVEDLKKSHPELFNKGE